MTTYTAIPDANLDPDSPARSVDAILLRDNPIAITEGSAGAPKIQAAALETTLAETSWLLARNAGATAGALGTYAFMDNVGGVTANPNNILSGSSLRYSSSTSSTGITIPTGTWRCMGYAPVGQKTLFLRIT